MSTFDDDTPKTPHCWKCGNWGSGIQGYRLHPAHKMRYKCVDEKACDERALHALMRARLGI